MKTNISTLAERFLAIADELNEQVSHYLNGSNAPEDIEAYHRVRAADKEFVDAVNLAEGERYAYGLNYELAEAHI